MNSAKTDCKLKNEIMRLTPIKPGIKIGASGIANCISDVTGIAKAAEDIISQAKAGHIDPS